MTVTALPTAPSRADPSTFSTRADALLGALVSPFVSEVNATAATVTASEANAVAQAAAALVSANNAANSAASAAAYDNATGTSTSSITISIGTGKVFTTQAGKSWVAGMPVVAYFDASNYMICTVASYSSTTLTLDCSAIVGSGTRAVWGLYSTAFTRLPIFSSMAANLSPLSSTETLENSLSDTGLGAQSIKTVVYGNSLFLAAAGSNANIATAPDVTGNPVWTLRGMPSTAAWALATNGTTGFVATVGSATTTAKSTNGTTWVAGGALPAAAHATYSTPVYNGTTALVVSNTASTVYTTPDNGANWTGQTTPTTINSNAFVVGGLFWYYSATNVAYTSATGATGSYTSRTLPISGPNYIWQDFDGSLVVSVDNKTLYRTTDGINWNLVTVTSKSTYPMRSFNGVYANFNSTLGGSYSYHNGASILRVSICDDATYQPTFRAAKNSGGTIFMIPNGAATGKVIYVEPGATTASTALFSR